MDFIAGLVIGIILMMAIATIHKNKSNKEHMAYIGVLHKTNCELSEDREWWRRQALLHSAELGEKLIAESRELCKKVDEFQDKIYEL